MYDFWLNLAKSNITSSGGSTFFSGIISSPMMCSWLTCSPPPRLPLVKIYYLIATSFRTGTWGGCCSSRLRFCLGTRTIASSSSSSFYSSFFSSSSSFCYGALLICISSEHFSFSELTSLMASSLCRVMEFKIIFLTRACKDCFAVVYILRFLLSTLNRGLSGHRRNTFKSFRWLIDSIFFSFGSLRVLISPA